MSKRPPSFGHYTNADTLQQLCHRCDSNDLRIVPSYDSLKMVNLEFGHPDRQGLKICKGKKVCFNFVGFPDGMCPSCSHTLTEFEKYRDTCLERGDAKWCEGCKEVYGRDGGIIVRLIREKKRLEKEDLQLKEESEKIEVEKSLTKRRKMMSYMNYQFERSLYIKERNKIIKR